MQIKNLSVKNFKSIKNVELSFNSLTLIVGANASGKSNLINVFRFISNIMTMGIDNAIALQGGIPYLSNASLQKGTPIEIAFTVDLSHEGWIKRSDLRTIGFEVKEINCHFIIQPNLRGYGYHISSDELSFTFNCVQVNQNVKKEDKYFSLDENLTLQFERKASTSTVQPKFIFSSNSSFDEKTKNEIEKDTTSRFFSMLANEDKKELMLYRISVLLPPIFSDSNFIRIFDFDPKELKKASSMASIRRLNEDGSNLASVLQSILRTKDNKRKLTSLLKEFLPFINGITIENNLDKSFSYKIQEQFSNKSFHANFLSDGTVSVLAIIIALYFESDSNIVILEEPERNIHPKLLANLLNSADEVSLDKQVIITTHNPELLKHTNIENICLIKRDDSGFSSVLYPKESVIVNHFLQNDLGIDDLFVQNMLED